MHWNKPCRYKTVRQHPSFALCSQLLTDHDRLENSHWPRWLMWSTDLTRYRHTHTVWICQRSRFFSGDSTFTSGHNSPRFFPKFYFFRDVITCVWFAVAPRPPLWVGDGERNGEKKNLNNCQTPRREEFMFLCKVLKATGCKNLPCQFFCQFSLFLRSRGWQVW